MILAVILILAAGAYGLTRVLDSGSSSAGTGGGVSQPAGPISWLGMQIETIPPATVVVETVASGSAAERAGIEPGDVIVDVNGQPVNATGDITTATASLRGGYVPIQVSRGSTLVNTQAAFAGPPSSHP